MDAKRSYRAKVKTLGRKRNRLFKAQFKGLITPTVGGRS